MASQRWRWLEFCQWSTFAQRSSTSALTSRPFVAATGPARVQPEGQRQGFGQAFRQAAGRRLVPIVQLALELLERAQRLVVRRPVVRALEALPHRLLVLGQVTHHVLARPLVGPRRGLSSRPTAAPCRRRGSLARDAHRDDHHGIGKRLAVQDHGHHVLTQVPFLELPQLRRAGLDEARDTVDPDRSRRESSRRRPRSCGTRSRTARASATGR